ncbi:putative thiol peroxidase [Dokdonia pacifica]|uniref:Thiol peroxidase n=1 Tax=Dokdonia pacifica TaxID=1627892 RepID=A0A238ZRS4_9FLAO|nr:thiol peroxidase [Dokdonia pacifica]GGG07846.1 putative thiol peroxidase [Dokdonia pacifica]SNR85363.1 thiol peroxidase (atypical 2-Cys peroxiredoxin) [Dokdonia pacifica]
MASVTLGGTPVNTISNLPEVGSPAPAFTLSRNDLSSVTLNDYRGKKLVLNIFPSVDTGVCAQSIRTFNEKASALENTEVLCISRDLPFAQARFCGAEGIENVSTLSDFKRGEFGKDYGVELIDGGFEGLHSRAIVVVDEKGKVIHTEQVSEIGHEPNYEAALNALS